MNELDSWVEAACAELGLQPDDVKAGAVLDVARDVAHQVLRPGAPVTAYLMGVAVGRGADASDVAGRLSALALAWPSRNTASVSSSTASASSNTGSASSNAASASSNVVPASSNVVPASSNTGSAGRDTGSASGSADVSSASGGREAGAGGG